MNYAQGKGYSGFLGLIGIIPVLGLIVLALLRDLDRPPPPRSIYTTLDRGALLVALACAGFASWRYLPGPHTTFPRAAQEQAVKSYPQLAVADSPLHREFITRYKAYQKTNREYFKDPNWPSTLARESQSTLDRTAKKSGRD